MWLLLVIGLAWGTATAREMGEDALMTVCPDRVDINAFYKGATLQIHGECPACDNVAILVRGPVEKAEFKRKGRELLLWMTVARVEIENVPVAYVLQTSGEVDDIAGTPEADSLEIGYPTLRHRIRIESDKPLEGNEFDEYLQFKEAKELYRIEPGAVTLEAAEDGKARFSSQCQIPAVVPPGEYTVNMYAFREGKLVGHEEAPLPIQKTGMPRDLTDLAFDHPALYGVVAILVAMAAGMLMGVLFNRKNKGVH